MTIQIAATGPAYDSGLGSELMKLNAGMPAPAKNAGMNARAPRTGRIPCSRRLNSSRRKRR